MFDIPLNAYLIFVMDMLKPTSRRKNMKKFLLIVLVCLLAASTLFAADYKGASKKDSFGIGLNLGTNTGVIVNYGFGKFDLEAIVGFGFIGGNGLNAEVAGNFCLVDFAKGNFDGSMPLTIGAEGYLATNFDFFRFGALVPVKVAYTFPKFPMSLYIRVAPGIDFDCSNDFKPGFAFHGSLGATYNF